jgi:zinc finger BED domain-containing protein 1 (E3 SUMO-protein ligase ZBED1)
MDKHDLIRHVENLVVEVLKVMIGINIYALTCDHWTSIAGSTFLAVTCHFINENWEIISLMLTCSEHRRRTTAAHCKKAIEEVLKNYDFKLQNAVALVTDTENTMSALGKLIDGDHHYCAAHVLELTTVSFYY